MYSNFDLCVSNRAGHTPKDDLNSSMEAADSTLEDVIPLFGCPSEKNEFE